MKLSKWGNSLALRIPADVAEELHLAPGDEVQVKIAGKNKLEIVRDRRREEAVEALRRLAVPMPPGYKFDRDEIFEREWVKRIPNP